MLVVRAVDLGIWKREAEGGPFRKMYVEPRMKDIFTFSSEDIEEALIEFLKKKGYDSAERGQLVFDPQGNPEIEVIVE